MKRHTAAEAIFPILILFVLLSSSAHEAYVSAKLGKWGYFWIDLFAIAVWSACGGVVLVSGFNEWQRRRRAAQKT